MLRYNKTVLCCIELLDLRLAGKLVPGFFLQEVISSIQSDMRAIPDDISTSHPAELRFAIIAPLPDPSVQKRLMTCVLAALRANGK
jgi:hypothetical protein